MATPLHNHTHFSALDGLSKPENIAKRVGDLGYEAVAVTDHDVVAGHLSFYNTISEAGLKPILGIETYQAPKSRFENSRARRDKDTGNKIDGFHLILLAQNNTGLRNLWRLNTEAHRTGFYYNARVDWDLLREYNEGIIATSACALGLVQQALQGNSMIDDAETILQQYLSIFGDRFYLELSTYPEEFQKNVNLDTVSLAGQYGVPMVYANDAHYAFPEQAPLHEVTLCMQYREKLADRTEDHHKPALYIMGEDEISEHLDYLPFSVWSEAIKNSDEIGKMCNVTMPERRKRVPVFVPDKGYKTSKEMLFELAVKGFEEKVTGDEDMYMARFEKEMQVIYDAQLVDYFLIVRDYIDYARRTGVPVGPGRGSIGGSLVAYLLGITEVDPIRYDLIFERFYNAGREKSLPDIDTDFSVAGREKVKAYVAGKYGLEYVADIGSYQTMQGKKAINSVGTVLGIPRRETEAIGKIIQHAVDAGLQPKWDEIFEEVGEELEPFKVKHPQLFEYAEELYDHIFAWGVHPSGVIVSDEPLGGALPLRWHVKDKKMVTQWDFKEVEKLGFMKSDFLGLRNLDTLAEVEKILGKKIDWAKVQYENHPTEMWELMDKGFTVGVFQIEDGSGARKVCKVIKPRSVEDLALVVGMNRPGPLRSGALERYAECRTGIKQPRYLNKYHEAATSETYGEFIFQEQVIKFFTGLGYSLEEADDIREYMGKKKKAEMAKAHQEYTERARKLMDSMEAEALWQRIENFAKYGFNKAHAIEYAIIQLRTIYAKYHYPKEFILAGMRTVDKKDQARWIREAARMGIAIYPPDINKSDVYMTVDGDGLRYGLGDVKHVGKSAAKWIVDNRPYKDFDELDSKRHEDERKISLPSGIRRVGITGRHIDALQSLASYTDPANRIEKEEELLGVAISDNSAIILDEHKDEIEENCIPLDDLDTVEPGAYNIAGIISEIRHAKTRAGKEMAWVKIENAGTEREIAVWNSELERLRFIWRRRQAVVAQVKVNDRGTSLIAAKALYSKSRS